MNTTDIPIASPCGADWRTMKASDTKRFCDTCKKHVHDLSSMTRAQARALLSSPPTEGLCVRYIHDATGELYFRDRPVPPQLLVRAKRLAAAASMVLPLSLNACMGAMEAPQPVMGSAVAPSASSSTPVATPPATSATTQPTVVEVMGAPPAQVEQQPPTTPVAH